MKCGVILVVAMIAWGTAQAQRPSTQMLFNGWGLSPAGKHVRVSDMPLKMVFSSNGKHLLMTCGGLNPGVAVVEVGKREMSQFVPLPRAFNGIAFNRDGKDLFVSGGNSEHLFRFKFEKGRLSDQKAAALGLKVAFLAGMAVSPQTGKLYVCNEASDELLVVDPDSLKITQTIRTRSAPHSCVFGGKKSFIYVSNWGDSSVSAIDTVEGREAFRINVGIRPNDMALAADGRLFVACAGDNTVHVLPTLNLVPQRDADESIPPPDEALEIISTSLYPSSPEGSEPDGVAVTPDGKTLYVANADNNDVVVVDISDRKASVVRGFVPVGWYPSAVAADNHALFVANGKGLKSRANIPAVSGETRISHGVKFDAEAGCFQGWLSSIDTPDDAALVQYTAQVRQNSPFTPECLKHAKVASDCIVPDQPGKPCPIKHVLYIIKENRTYDQMMGDFKNAAGRPAGNGDPRICMYGEKVTPNHHQLARDYVLLDNLYCNGEVSMDGHSWCDAAITTDYRQRRWIVQYTRHGELPGNKQMDVPTAGFLWDVCQRQGVSFKCYGEGSRNVPSNNRGTWPEGRDTDRAEGWIKDLHEAEKSGELPRFMIMSLGEDHTRGTTPGAHTPDACVASNDLALGRIVEAASQSKFWKEMAIFVIEDDAQAGPDHVDSHRTFGVVVGPWIKRGVVDSTMYSTTSMIRTMELILGLPPMTQYDGGATPMFNCFARECVPAVYRAKQPEVDLAAVNRENALGAKESAAMNFDEYDEAPEDPLNRILWAAANGPDAPYPTPIHRAVFTR